MMMMMMMVMIMMVNDELAVVDVLEGVDKQHVVADTRSPQATCVNKYQL